MRLRAACADPFSPQGIILHRSDPILIICIQQVIWLSYSYKGFVMESPPGVLCKCLPEISLWQRWASGYTWPRAFSEHNNCGWAVWRTLGTRLPSVLEETLRTVIRHPPGVSKWTWESPRSDSHYLHFHKRVGVRAHLILSKTHRSLDN